MSNPRVPEPNRAAAERALPSDWEGRLQFESLIANGSRNVTWLVSSPYQGRLVLRKSLKPVPAITWEMQLLGALRDEGFVVPGVVPTSNGSLSTTDGWTLTTFLDGVPPASSGDWSRVARQARLMHEVTRDWPQCPGAYSIVEGNFDQLIVNGLEVFTQAEVALLQSALDLLARETPAASVIHSDLNMNNILLIAGREPAFVDWDEARVDYSCLEFGDSPLADLEDTPMTCRLACLAWEILRSVEPEPAYARRRFGDFQRLLSAGRQG